MTVDELAFIASFLAVVCAGAVTLASLGRIARTRGGARRLMQGLALFAGCIALLNMAAPLLIEGPFVRSAIIYIGLATVPIWLGVRALVSLTYNKPRRTADT